jgi:hypothetical protein
VSEIKDDLKDLGERMKADMKKGRNKTQAKNQDPVEQSPSTEIPSDEIQTKIKSNKQTSTTAKNNNESVSLSSES